MDEKESILLVDDADTLISLTSILADKGYRTETASTGREALEKAREKFFNAVLLDIKLPDTEGVELLAPLKEMHPDTVVIMLTGYPSLETAIRALNHGALAYTIKPLNVDDVLAKLREALEKQRLVMENRRLCQKAQQELAERRLAQEALEASRANFHNIVEKSADAILIIDRNGIVQFANQAAEWLFGRKAEELVGEWFGFPVVAGETTEIDIVYKDGEIAMGEMRVVETEWEGKTAYLASVRDITERVQAQKVQEGLSRQLQAKVSELEAFSYGIAHDLRSPLLSIEGFSRTLRDDIQNLRMEMVQEDIRLLRSGVRKMQQFLNRTLEYSRAGHLVNPTMNVPFGKIVEEVTTEFAERLRSIGATVSLADTFPKVYVDRIRMSEVLTNLIQNSINYRDKTMPLTIEIGYWLSGNEVVFFVRDNGVGIDASEAEKVFDLFYRGTADGEGSGIGLAIVKSIIGAHGGRIWVEQGQSGKGITICFALPQQSGINNRGSNG